MNNYFNEIKKYGVLTFEEEQDLFNKLSLGDNTARETLIKHNLALVISISKKYYYLDNFDDIISNGNIGLINAINNFNHNTKNKFNSFAYKYIKGYILKYINKHNKLKTNSLDEIIENNYDLYDKIEQDIYKLPDDITDDSELLLKLVNWLDGKERDLIIEHYINDIKINDISKKYGIDRRMIYYYINNGLIKLKNRINNINLKESYGSFR
jgi:RNA polymerase sigma factor (sigma-70 family)